MKPIKKLAFLVILIGLIHSLPIKAEQPVIMNGAEIKIALKKLLGLGSVLYIAAHPDDENTAVLAYMSSQRSMRSGYLSLTRGGGGQNLIGTEKGPLMSVLRTHELMAARKIDGAEQFFTRAVDFGYSKTAEESMAIWGKEEILGDIVFIIRKFQPDVLLTRFGTGQSGSGHGHHTASALLAVEAFHAAGDPSRFPEQLNDVSPWKPKRIFWNTWKPYLKDAKPEETAQLIALDVGQYNPLLGKSYYEIASQSRSMHKSQGFGSVPFRGRRLDYFELLAGEPAKEDLFEGIDTTWNRVPGAETVRTLLEKANRSFQVDQPHTVLPFLLDALAGLKSLKKSYWTIQKTNELKEVIRSCAGLWLEAAADSHTVTPGQEVKVTAAAINRSAFPFTLAKIIIDDKSGMKTVLDIGEPLTENQPFKQEFSMNIPRIGYTHPFWLKETPLKGIYRSANHELKGLAAAPYPINITMVLTSGDRAVRFDAPVIYRWRDPVEGELIRGLTVTPPVTVNFTEQVFYFTGCQSRELGLILRSGPAAVSGTLKLCLPSSWQAEPKTLSFTIDEPFTERQVSFKLTPPAGDTVGAVQVEAAVGGRVYDRSRVTIDYPHLPLLTLHPKAEARMVRVEIKRTGRRLGYIMGSGDDIPVYLEQVGYQVDILGDEELHNVDFAIYDAVITGVRAYNTRDILPNLQPRLMDYVKNGGRLIVQYNVSRGLKLQQLGPYPFRLSHQRVTREEAPITLIEPDHPLFDTPNKIEAADFEGWVQERGLYFADQWDNRYTPLLACNDSGEDPQTGGLLFARYGKGVFIYTGYSFFRQLPAGVPGALKLFINLITK